MSKDNRSYTKLCLAGERDAIGQPSRHYIVSSGRTRCHRTTVPTLHCRYLAGERDVVGQPFLHQIDVRGGRRINMHAVVFINRGLIFGSPVRVFPLGINYRFAHKNNLDL
ncbi:uncharacterized protein [Atheta coriaria]|uniref:uncharacterized protein isoform X1 n=1 Tax=Dalotia coriaria TaxID=877792 RepID=UPI0031F368D0